MPQEEPQASAVPGSRPGPGIILPPESPPSIEQRLRGAIYAASAHNQVIPLHDGARTAYLVPAHIYKEWLAAKAGVTDAG